MNASSDFILDERQKNSEDIELENKLQNFLRQRSSQAPVLAVNQNKSSKIKFSKTPVALVSWLCSLLF